MLKTTALVCLYFTIKTDVSGATTITAIIHSYYEIRVRTEQKT